ncbi:MAG: hypothetical protein QNK37_34760 [Acidobacteriota bacterium]|nr:hypothetical protein [Acidobacteriota bacterium]
MKLSLPNLKIQSFVTLNPDEKKAVRAGIGETFKRTYCDAPGGCTWYCTGTGAC